MLSVTEAVSVTGWRCAKSKPELETVNKKQLVFDFFLAKKAEQSCRELLSHWTPLRLLQLTVAIANGDGYLINSHIWAMCIR